jgi:hypothetical protein
VKHACEQFPVAVAIGQLGGVRQQHKQREKQPQKVEVIIVPGGVGRRG